jgi:two-component system LytT family response regulator
VGDDYLRVYILDKKNDNRELMRHWLSQKQNVSVVEIFEDQVACIERVEYLPPDLCFIRLGIESIPGLKTARMIHIINPEIRLVFVTEGRDYALDAYEIGAYGYLLLPLEKGKFDRCLSGNTGFNSS